MNPIQTPEFSLGPSRIGENPTFGVSNLPNKMVTEIISYLTDDLDLQSAALVNKQWNALTIPHARERDKALLEKVSSFLEKRFVDTMIHKKYSGRYSGPITVVVSHETAVVGGLKNELEQNIGKVLNADNLTQLRDNFNSFKGTILKFGEITNENLKINPNGIPYDDSGALYNVIYWEHFPSQKEKKFQLCLVLVHSGFKNRALEIAYNTEDENEKNELLYDIARMLFEKFPLESESTLKKISPESEELKYREKMQEWIEEQASK